MFLGSEHTKNLHAATLASMLMKGSGLLHEAAMVPFLYASISLAYFEAEKGFFLSIIRLSKNTPCLLNKECIDVLHCTY